MRTTASGWSICWIAALSFNLCIIRYNIDSKYSFLFKCVCVYVQNPWCFLVRSLFCCLVVWLDLCCFIDVWCCFMFLSFYLVCKYSITCTCLCVCFVKFSFIVDIQFVSSFCLNFFDDLVWNISFFILCFMRDGYLSTILKYVSSHI